MYCATIGRAVSLTLILSSHFMADYGMAVEKPPEPNNGYLTVRQSLLAMYALGDLGGPAAAVVKQFPFNRLNPNVREYARFYLERDNTVKMNIYGALCLLGFVGNEDDISFIEQYVDKILSCIDSGKDDGAIERSKSFSWERMALETINVYKGLI